MVLVLGMGSYIAIPKIAQNVIRRGVEREGYTVDTIALSWPGPQLITGMRVHDVYGSADIDLEISNGLTSLLFNTTPIIANATGDAVVTFPQEVIRKKTNSQAIATVPVTPKEKKIFLLPKLELTLSLNTLTVEFDEPLFYNNVKLTVDVDPGHHFVAELNAETIIGGFVKMSCNAPSLIKATGEINPECDGTLSLNIENAEFPTINGVSGWVVDTFKCAISSPNMSESYSVGLHGSFTEFDEERGTIFCKTQLLKSAHQDAFTFGEWAVIGSIHVSDVPTSILAIFLDSAQINTMRDLGPTMDVKLSRASSDGLPIATFNTRDLRMAATIDTEQGVLTNVEIEADMHTELVETLSGGELSGNPTVSINLERLVPVGLAKDSLVGEVTLDGKLHHIATNSVVENLHSTVHADVFDRFISISGTTTIEGEIASFEATLRSPNKNKLDGIDDLWKTIANQLPRGEGEVVLNNVSTSLLGSLIIHDGIKPTRDFGETFDATIKFLWTTIETTFKTSTLNGSCTANVNGEQIVSVQDIRGNVIINKHLATSLLNTNSVTDSTLQINDSSFDFNGNSEFDIHLDIDKQPTVVRGYTTRNTEGLSAGNLDAHIAATGLDTRLLESFCNTNGILIRSIGSPIAVEIIGSNILDEPLLNIGGTSPNAAFETSIMFVDGVVSTVKETTSIAELTLSQDLTKHLLKDLGPVLSDIRSIDKPIQFRISNARASLDGNLSELNADVTIDIGKVALDSGSLTMQLLPMFNTKHVDVIPAYFEKIHISIRNGIATYKEFRLTLANKYTIPYSGTINLVTRRLQLKTAIPLTGLGYSIKELRGLATDIDVPVLITGTIEQPRVRVDPSFDLAKILLESTVGNLIDQALGSENDAPNPLDILEELFNNRK